MVEHGRADGRSGAVDLPRHARAISEKWLPRIGPAGSRQKEACDVASQPAVLGGQ